MSDLSRLPARPSFEQLQKQAKERVRESRANAHPVTLAQAQFELARQYGFESWAKLKHHVGAITDPHATDATVERLTRSEHITSLNFDGSTQLTDRGLAFLTRMPQIEELNISGTQGQITDRGLSVLRHLPNLRRFQMCWQPNVSDAGLEGLRSCSLLETVNLMGTSTGDAVLAALAGKPHLRHLKTGRYVTDRGIALLREFPVFKQWRGGDIQYDLVSAGAEPNSLLIDGPFTDAGIRQLAKLEGVAALTFFWHASDFTSGGIGALKHLPHLHVFGIDGARCDDEAMRQIAGFPQLGKVLAQGTIATDAGFSALARSATIEYIWGRECPNLTGTGFEALARMPSLRGLAVSCRNVGDQSLSLLPRFPALKELLPMDASDDGFRHIGRCENLEALWCMYCRDTGDVATTHIAGLQNLKSYYAGKTKITDRSLEILARMQSLERLEFWACPEITNSGVAHLAHLPRLREITFDATGATREVAALFPPHVKVNYSG